MKTFNQLNINDVLYILTEYDDLYICKVTKIIESWRMKRIIYDYADKYTVKMTSRYIDIPEIAFDDTSYMESNAACLFELYLNKNEVLEDLDKRIDILMKHKGTLNNLYK
jgi:hypothetical protein